MLMQKLSILVLFILILIPSPTYSQGDGNSSPTTIHVVQRGENLYRIAQQYGVTVQAIANINGITDPRFVEAGQRLLIPNPQSETSGTLNTHVVQPGETLYTIALRYQSSADKLALQNNITHPSRLYAGEVLQISQSETGDAPLDGSVLYTMRPNEHLFSVAARFGIPVASIKRANRWATLPLLVEGDPVIIPNQPETQFVVLPPPLSAFRLGPLPALQGESIGLYFETDYPVDTRLQFMGREIMIASLGNNQYGTMLGVHAMTEPGVYNMTLRLSTEVGLQLTYPIAFEVIDGDYGFETIAIPTERQDLLDSVIVQSELEKVTGVMSQFTSKRYFDGLMSLPAPGSVTSGFGTRRSYNGSETITFHGGADFGGVPGTEITAPADGIVVLVEPLQVRGNVVIIDHGWGVYTGYWHQQETFVLDGQFIQKGGRIGTIGSTGLSTGAHLHWEMWVSGVQVNPLQWAKITFP